MHRARAPLIGLFLLLAGAVPSTVAQTSVCHLLPGASQLNRIVDADGRTTSFISGPARFRCSDGTVLEADSAVHTEEAQALELIGQVLYRDSAKTLRAEWVNHLGDTEQLFARDDVVLTDLETGSVVRGPRLEHREAGDDSTRAGAGIRPRPRSRTVVYGGRAHATMPAQTDSAASPGDTSAAPLEVEADRIEIDGQEAFDAFGGVELERGTLRGFGEEVRYRRTDGYLRLTRDARVEDASFQLFGDTIVGTLVDDELREVEAERDAVLLANDLRVDAARLRILLEQGEVHRLVARSPASRPALAAEGPGPAVEDDVGADAEGEAEVDVEGEVEGEVEGGAEDSTTLARDPGELGLAERRGRSPAAPDTGRARAGEAVATATADAAPDEETGRPRIRASNVELVADSIDARAPGQQLERVVAVGRAYGERLADSLRVGLPEGIDRDWVRGDTIIGYFTVDTAATPAGDSASAQDGAGDAGLSSERDRDRAVASADTTTEADTAQGSPEEERPRPVLERLVSIGGDGDARSIYRSWEQSGEEARPGINYIIAKRITLSFKDGEVEHLEADGPVRGINLQPEGGPSTESDAEATSSTADPTGS